MTSARRDQHEGLQGLQWSKHELPQHAESLCAGPPERKPAGTSTQVAICELCRQPRRSAHRDQTNDARQLRPLYGLLFGMWRPMRLLPAAVGHRGRRCPGDHELRPALEVAPQWNELTDRLQALAAVACRATLGRRGPFVKLPPGGGPAQPTTVQRKKASANGSSVTRQCG